MAKLLLVEDDINLRDIYATRLQAEGHEVSTASDGEEALAVAVKVKPDLIVLDVMMPKISGFDVLDIIRSTPETKSAKVIMMTALSQASDRERGEKLGADKYLVKSQVTLEDVVGTINDILGKSSAPAVSSVSSGSNNSGAKPAIKNKEGKSMDPQADTNQPDDTGAAAPAEDTAGGAPAAGDDGAGAPAAGTPPADPGVPSEPAADAGDDDSGAPAAGGGSPSDSAL